jgi:hypothetical protein
MTGHSGACMVRMLASIEEVKDAIEGFRSE